MRSAACAFATSSRWTAFGERSELSSQCSDCLADLIQLGRALAAGPSQLVAVSQSRGDDGLEFGRHALSRLGDGSCNFRSVRSGAQSPLGANPRFSFRGGRTPKRIGLSAYGFRTLFGGAHGKASIHFDDAHFGERCCGHFAIGSGRFRTVSRCTAVGFGDAQTFLQIRELCQRLTAALLGTHSLGGQPLGFRVGDSCCLPQSAQLLVDGGHGGVRLVEPLPKVCSAVSRRAACSARAPDSAASSSSDRLSVAASSAADASIAACTSSVLGCRSEPPIIHPEPCRSPERVTARIPLRSATTRIASSRVSTRTTPSRMAVNPARNSSGQSMTVDGRTTTRRDLGLALDRRFTAHDQ